MTKKRYYFLFLTFILLIGLSLRYYDLDKESIWTDEEITMQEAKKSSITEVVDEVVAMEAFPPGYPIIMHYWIRVFGNSEFSIRLPSLICGVMSIFLLFLIASQLFNRYIGSLAAFFMATGMLQVMFSQEARLYSLFGFLALVSTYALIKWYKSEEKRWLVSYILVSVIAVYVNYLTVFLIAFQLIALYSKSADYTRKMVAQLLVALVLCLPLGTIVIRQFIIHHARWIFLLEAYGFPEFLSKIGLFLFAIPLSGLTIFFLFLVKRQKTKPIRLRKREKVMIGLGLLMMGAVYLSTLNIITRSFVLVRHPYFLVPIVYVMMAKYIAASRKRMQIALIIIVILFNITAISVYYEKTTKPDWRGVAEFISKESAEAPSIIFMRAGSNVGIFRYYFGNDFKEVAVDAKWDGRIGDSIGEKGLWLLVSGDKGAGREMMMSLQQDHEVYAKKDFPGIEVYHYKKI